MRSRPDQSATTPRAGHDPLGPESARPLGRDRSAWAYFLIFFGGAALILFAMWWHIHGQRTHILTYWQGVIQAIASDRARLVDNWLEARRADAEVLAASPAVKNILWIKGPDTRGLVDHLNQVVEAYGYEGVVVSDTGGRSVAKSTQLSISDEDRRKIALAVAGSRRSLILMGDDPQHRRILTIAAPVFAGNRNSNNRAVLGVVTLQMNAETGLFALLAGETPPRTDETLLVRVEEKGSATYLSRFSHPDAGWEAVDRSLREIQRLAKEIADEGGTRYGEVEDYRAVPVLTAVARVPITGWLLSLKVDREEVLSEFHRAGQLTGTAGAFLLVALAACLIAFWRQRQRAQLLRAQVDQERAISSLRGYAEKIVDSVPSGLLLLSADLDVLSVNPSFLDAFRLSRGDVVGRRLLEVVQADGLARRANDVLETGVAQRNMLLDLYLPQRRESRPGLVTITGIRMGGEKPARLLLIVQDLTEEERLQAARRTSEERFRDLVNGLDAIVWEANAATFRFSFVSQRAEGILGYPSDRWLGGPDFFAERIHPDDRARVLSSYRDAIAKGGDHEIEYRALAVEGRELWLRDIVHVVPTESGRPVQLRGVTVDLTDGKRAEEALRQAEDQLRQAQKMDAVGKLAGGIAHDFNNLLMVIRGESDLILRRLDTASPMRQNAEGIREAADQAATLTRQLLAFSRKQVVTPAVIDLNSVVDGIRKILPRLIGETIQFAATTQPDLARVKADPGQLEQMILNLVVNARDAMPNGGRLSMLTQNVEVDADTARQRGVSPGPHVMLEVSDTGVGMDAETRSHLFEPFFTTKAQGKGTGLGLSTVYGIVNQSGGHIWVHSELGAGTTFRIYLPRATDVPAPEPAAARGPERGAAETGAEARAAEPGAAGRETILLVEDARRVREVVREILEMTGYEVLEARHGAEALEISAAHDGPIHLMVTDVVMPQMSGRELAQRLAPLRPDMRVLYMSGYTDDAIVRHGVLDAGIAFIPKPFTPDALAAKVRQVLDAPIKAPGSRSRRDPETVGAAEGAEGAGRHPSRA
jgi:PAS domain S-box-containing protein